MTSNELRKKYTEFFKSKNHAEIQAAPLLAENDPSLLFVNSGMFPLVSYLSGQSHPQGKRLVNCQRSFRAEDIEEIGDHRHDTFFEMLGNWSLGDYFKEEHLNWLYEFLIEKIKLDPKKLYQTVFAGSEYAPKDIEAIEILKKIYNKYGIPAEVGPETLGKGELGSGQEIKFGGNIRIFPYRDKNWWKRGDAIGELGGPDSETFYDTGRMHDPKFGAYCHLNCDCGRFIEIGNSVFMEYIKTAKGWEKKLPQKNVDFGGGLERLVMVSEGKTNIFETDIFDYLVEFLEKRSGKKYKDFYKSFEIVADHMRAATFLIADGGVPSNKEHGYIIRRLIRRASVHLKKLGVDLKETASLSELVIHHMADAYPYLEYNKARILDEIKKEEKRFETTLEKGLKLLLEDFGKIIDVEKIEYEIKESTEKNQKIISDAVDKIVTGKKLFDFYQTFGFPLEVSLEELQNRGVKFINSEIERIKGEFQKELQKHQELSRTSSAGKFKGGLADQSEQTTKYHTATHLLLASLRKVLGEHVFQKGSNITGERMRFDFSHPEKMTKEQIEKVEDLVNGEIQKDLPVVMQEMDLDEAKKIGAMGVFGSKYGARVKVYAIGDEKTGIFSREICGGPHVPNTGILGKFKIKKEEASSAGVRRIKAVLE